MSKHEEAEGVAEGIAGKVLESLAKDERTISWLSRKTGISYKTLRNRLVVRPASLSIADAFIIASALEVPVADLLLEEVNA